MSNAKFQFILNEGMSYSFSLDESYDLPLLGFRSKVPILSENVSEEKPLNKVVQKNSNLLPPGKPVVVSLNSLSKAKYMIVKKNTGRNLQIPINKSKIVNVANLRLNDALLECATDDHLSNRIFEDHSYCALNSTFEYSLQDKDIEVNPTNFVENDKYTPIKIDSKYGKMVVKKLSNISMKQRAKCVDKEVQVNLEQPQTRVDKEINTDEDLFEEYINSRLLEKSMDTPSAVDINAINMSDFEGLEQKVSPTLLHSPVEDMSPLHDFDYDFIQDFSSLLNEEGNNFTFSAIKNDSILSTDEKWKIQFFLDLKHCNCYDSLGNMPLHVAVIKNNLNLVRRQCMVLKLRNLSLDLVNNNSLTSLQLAVLHQANIQILQELLNHNSNPTVTDQEGNTLLHLAVVHSSNVIFRMLLVPNNLIDIDATNFEGYTALILCVLNRQYIKTEMLLSVGANPNLCDQKSGRTALFHAVEKNDVKMVRMLLAHNAQTKVRSFSGSSPHDAVFELETISKSIKKMIVSKK